MKFIGLILAVLLIGCGQSAVVYDLSKMPKYDVESVNAQWEAEVVPMEQLSGDFAQLAMLASMYGLEVDEKTKAKLQDEADKFTYWSAVTKLKVYHSDPTASDSRKKAEAAINKAIELLEKSLTEKMSI